MSKSTTLKGTEFNFAAQPNVVRAKKKYRTANGQDYDPENFRYQNVMFEKRVVRGNTHSQYMVANNEVEEAPLPQ
jgi:Radial spoke protein 3